MVVLAAVAAVTRATLFGLLDASSWNGVQARYLLPAVPAFAAAAVVGLAILSRVVRHRGAKTTLVS